MEGIGSTGATRGMRCGSARQLHEAGDVEEVESGGLEPPHELECSWLCAQRLVGCIAWSVSRGEKEASFPSATEYWRRKEPGDVVEREISKWI